VRPAAGGKLLIYRLLILFGLMLAGVAIWLTLDLGLTGPITAQTNRAANPEQGYSATDAQVVETGADGLPMYTLQAKQVQQEPDANLVNLTTVHMTFRDQSGGQWQGRSDHAQVQQDSEQIDLSGSVDVSGLFAGNDQPAHVLTDTLHVDTRTDIISTQAAVTLLWGGYVVDAIGLIVNIKNDHLKLESQVHGHLVP
jgi:LPS export ABC transporter protein LptC